MVNIKTERKILDGIAVLIAFISAYAAGFIQVMNFGALSVPLMMPALFVILIVFMHLVIRKSRKFDKSEHRPLYEALKAFVFTGMVYTSYRTGLSVQDSLVPENIVMFGLASIFAVFSIFLMAYRANK